MSTWIVTLYWVASEQNRQLFADCFTSPEFHSRGITTRVPHSPNRRMELSITLEATCADSALNKGREIIGQALWVSRLPQPTDGDIFARIYHGS